MIWHEVVTTTFCNYQRACWYKSKFAIGDFVGVFFLGRNNEACLREKRLLYEWNVWKYFFMKLEHFF
jgi:hypothetical protein